MPKYEDLQFLKDKLLSLGKEVDILTGKSETPNLTDLPEKKEIIEDKSFIDTDDLLKDISDDFNEGLSFSEDENFDMKEEDNKDNFLDNISFDDISKEEEILESEPLLDNISDDYSNGKKEPKLKNCQCN